MSETLARAATFIWSNARLLERRLFAYHFAGGPRAAVLEVLLAYRNADGGFGNALEPDIRCPDSQTVPVQHALEILDAVGFEPEIARGACDFLQSVATAEGGVPFVLPAANRYPHAPWWSSPDNPPAALNPTAAICGLLHKHGFSHPWLTRADAFCWERIPAAAPEDVHELACLFTFLRHTPERERAERERERLARHLLAAGLVADVQAEGYVRKPLDWAPTPDHPLRPLFGQEAVAANLDLLQAGQQEDGGWTIAWPPVSPACGLEWRGWVTLGALLTLRANGRL